MTERPTKIWDSNGVKVVEVVKDSRNRVWLNVEGQEVSLDKDGAKQLIAALLDAM